MKKSIIKLMPIGGQAENGKSMYCLEIDDNWFIIDAGYRFPEVDKLGVDVIIPNFDYLKDNKDKIIISGNKSKKQISVIIEYNEDLINYFRNYKIDLLINKNNYDKNIKFELINNEKDVKKFKQVETLLNNDKINKKLCLYNQSNQDICKSKGNYIIKNTHYLNDNIYDIKNTLENGSIILIKKDTNLKDIKILLNQIKFQDLEIVYLSDLIKE